MIVPCDMDALKHMGEYDPEGAKFAEEQIWAGYSEAAGVSRKELKDAYLRVHLDGYYGPFADSEAEMEGLPPMQDALQILRDALQYQPCITYEHPDHGYICNGADECTHPDHLELDDNQPMFHCVPLTVDPDEIRDCLFGKLKEIYGHYNI